MSGWLLRLCEVSTGLASRGWEGAWARLTLLKVQLAVRRSFLGFGRG